MVRNLVFLAIVLMIVNGASHVREDAPLAPPTSN
jgi:hypothetical protein